MMTLRRSIMLAQVDSVPKIGGLPVYIDNAFYSGSNGAINNYLSNSEYFLTGIVDSGSTSSKKYTASRIGVGSNKFDGYLRLFNNLGSASVDYWSVMRSSLAYGTVQAYSFTSQGQFLIISVYKDLAANFYLKDANGNYLLKGTNVQ